MSTTPIHTLVLPYVATGRLTPEQGDKALKLLRPKLIGMSSEDTSIGYLVMVIEQTIKELNDSPRAI